MTFFATEDRSRTAARGLVDLRSGVLCATRQLRDAASRRARGVLRATVLANHDRWCALDERRTARRRSVAPSASLDVASRFVPIPRPHRVLTSVATPRTIRRYTGKLGGAVYGCPDEAPRRRDGDRRASTSSARTRAARRRRRAALGHHRREPRGAHGRERQ
jgi:hypothetical protein